VGRKKSDKKNYSQKKKYTYTDQVK